MTKFSIFPTRLIAAVFFLWLASTASLAAEMSLNIEIPRLKVAEYHRPYVAAWLQNQDTKEITNLVLWYQIDEDGKGEKWLKDLRQWWRRSGRSLTMPADGFSGATEHAGRHQVKLENVSKSLTKGEYKLYVEAAREVGGRELLNIPFQWPAQKTQVLEALGKSELGRIELHLTR